MHRLRSERTGLSYLSNEAEEGPLVVCLHGFPDIPRTWGPLTEGLRNAGYHVVCPWMPGYAPSSPEGPFDPLSIAETLHMFLDELSPEEPVRLVGHDWGSVVGQCLLLQKPTRFRAAALLSVPHLLAVEENMKEYPSQLLRSAYMGFFQLPLLSDRMTAARDFAFIERLWRKWSPGYTIADDYLDELKVCLRASMPAPIQYYRALRSPRVIRDLRALFTEGPIVVPTIYFHGEKDGCIAPNITHEQGAHFSALFEQVMLADAGHFAHLERPQEVNDAIIRWFEAH